MEAVNRMQPRLVFILAVRISLYTLTMCRRHQGRLKSILLLWFIVANIDALANWQNQMNDRVGPLFWLNKVMMSLCLTGRHMAVRPRILTLLVYSFDGQLLNRSYGMTDLNQSSYPLVMLV